MGHPSGKRGMSVPGVTVKFMGGGKLPAGGRSVRLSWLELVVGERREAGEAGDMLLFERSFLELLERSFLEFFERSFLERFERSFLELFERSFVSFLKFSERSLELRRDRVELRRRGEELEW